jgi:cobalt-precorrin 5A hydrolase/precorrin-3B C17-methyltransferase
MPRATTSPIVAGAPGTVTFVGAGPGDPELLTLKAQRLIAAADVILYTGSLINPAVLSYARPEARLHNSAGLKRDEQVDLMRDAVAWGKVVVRLHTGDPAVFGATQEQMRELDRLGIAYRVVPGVSSAFAAAAALGLELTVPGSTQTVILTRMPGQTPVPPGEALRELATHGTSLVIFLSVGMLEQVVDELTAAAYPPDTPIAVVFRASWPDEQVVCGTLANIVARVQDCEITHQALIIVGPALTTRMTQAPTDRSHLYGRALDAPARQPTIAVVALTRAGTRLGLRLQSQLPGSVLYAPSRHLSTLDATTAAPAIQPYSVAVRQVLQTAFRQHAALVCVMATGIVVRELAPVLTSKHGDPGVVVVDEAGRHAISLLASHLGGANHLAHQVAGALGGQAVISTASDTQGLPALDLLGQKYGWSLERAESMTNVIAALVNGQPVGVLQEAGDDGWLPDLAANVDNLTRYDTLEQLIQASPSAAVIITHRRVPDEYLAALPVSIIYRPRVLVIGVGCNRGTLADEILNAIDTTLDAAGLARDSVLRIATISDKADEAGLLEACTRRGWPLQVFTREEIATHPDLPNPSPWAQRVLGVPGVAEPAALLGAAAGNGASFSGNDSAEGSTTHGDQLLVEKRKFANVTVAVARAVGHAARSGSLAVVGIGPGAPEHLTPAARNALENADVIVGYHTYLDLITAVAPEVPRQGSGMRQEVERMRRAIDRAGQGERVAVVSGGDAGIYGMAGLALEMLHARGLCRLPVTIIPGVSALNAAAALLGAPLMTDFAAISLSDQLVPAEDILQRLEAAVQADFVLCLYNPRGKQRTELYDQVCHLLQRYRQPDTPVGVVRAAFRPEQEVAVTTLEDLVSASTPVDMVTTVIVGNSRTFVHNGRMITPRGYSERCDLRQ